MRSTYLALVAAALLPACQCGETPPADTKKDAGKVIPPDAGDEIVLGRDTGACADQDEDGYGPGCPLGTDCDDQDREVHGGATEACGNGKDDDCDGETDEADCGCAWGSTRECFSGGASKAGVGICRRGLQRCDDNRWGSCVGQVLPGTEECDGLDNDCNGSTDEGKRNACGTCGDVPQEICGDGIDNDCNDQMDDGCGTCDPGCQCTAGAACVCHPPINQPCFSGSPQSAGVGECRSGLHDCVQQGAQYVWNLCRGEVLPLAEACADHLDNDCDGQTDEGCTPGCTPAPEECNGRDEDCDGLTDEGVTNACGTCGDVGEEVCDDGRDNDCDGSADEDCACSGASQECYRGPESTLGKGQCKAGTQQCSGGEIATWGPCEGDVLPKTEVCSDHKDNDCDGDTDEGCECLEGAEQPCGSDVGECQAGTQTCHQNAWSACSGEVGPGTESCNHKDDDCDGLTDEGVLNACGKCPPEPCYTEDWSDPGNCSAPGRTCSGVVPDPNDPNSVTLGQSQSALLPYIYIAVTNMNQVAQLNTETGVKQWQANSWGVAPSRTAVALDGTVWVGNRCLVGSRDNDFTCSSMAHLDLQGNLICRADIPGWVRGVAIDGEGYVWAGTWNGKKVWKVSGTDVDGTQSPPRCRIVTSIALGVSVYGLAVDGRGIMWTASRPAKKIDTGTATVLDSVNHDGYYGIAIDKQNRVWFGGHSGDTDMHRVDPEPPHAVLHTGAMGITAVTVHPDGTIWGSSYEGTPHGVVRVTLNAAGTAVADLDWFADPDGAQNHGIAVDKANKLWSPQVWTVGYVNRWLPNGTHDGRFAVDPGRDLYTYSDMTGIQLRTITTREGHWFQVFDSGYASPTWDHAEWTANVPAGTTVSVQFRAADTQAAFGAGGATSWCGPFTTSPAALGGCAQLHGHRWIQADVRLNTTVDQVRPTFSDLKLFWSY